MTEQVISEEMQAEHYGYNIDFSEIRITLHSIKPPLYC